MAVKGDIPVTWAIPAGADLSGSQFAAIAIDGSGNAVLANDSTVDNYLGTLGNKPTSGQDTRVEVLGLTKALAGEAIAVGNPITFNTSGYYMVGAITTVIDSGISTNVDTATTLVGMAVSLVASGGIFTMFQRGVHTRTQSA